MKKQKRSGKPPLIITWDTETYRIAVNIIKEDGVILRAYLLGWYCDNEFYYSMEPHTDFFKFLENKSKLYSLHLWCFNAMYDLPVLIPEYLSKYDENCDFDYKVSENKSFIHFKYKGSKFKFTCYDAAVWYRQISSLDEWLRLVGRKKVEGFVADKWDLYYDSKTKQFWFTDTDGNKKFTTLESELKYLREDVAGLFDVVQYQRKSRRYLAGMFGFKSPKLERKSTSPSFAKELVDTWKGDGFFDATFRPLTDDEYLYNMMVSSSCGGFTACNKDVLVYHSPDARILSYDVNSKHPSIICAGIPKGEISETNKFKKSCKWLEVYMTKCEWKKDLSYISTPPLPSRWCKLDHPVFLLDEYYQKVKNRMDTDLVILGEWYQELTTVLAPLIRDLYYKKVEIQIEIKEDGETYERAFTMANTKLLMNSLYGKLDEKTYFEDHFYDPKTFEFTSNLLHVSQYRYKLSGIYIAQKARADLIGDMLTEIDNGNTFMYCDTDSLKFVINTPVSFKIDPYRLGYYKLENASEKSEGFTHFYSTGKIKKYLMFNEFDYAENKKGLKMALSGITRKVQAYLVKYGDLELFKVLYTPGNNVLISNGKLSRERNQWGQILLLPLDICLNRLKPKVTHILSFDVNDMKWFFRP